MPYVVLRAPTGTVLGESVTLAFRPVLSVAFATVSGRLLLGVLEPEPKKGHEK